MLGCISEPTNKTLPIEFSSWKLLVAFASTALFIVLHV